MPPEAGKKNTGSSLIQNLCPSLSFSKFGEEKYNFALFKIFETTQHNKVNKTPTSVTEMSSYDSYQIPNKVKSKLVFKIFDNSVTIDAEVSKKIT